MNVVFKVYWNNPIEMVAEAGIQQLTFEVPFGAIISNPSSGGGTASYPSFIGNAGKVLAVNPAEDDVEWTTVSSSGGRIHATLYASTRSSVTTILKSKNILSVVRTATGKHTITTASNMDDVNYTLLGMSSLQNSQTGGFIICENFGSGSTPVRTINSFQLETHNGTVYIDALVWGVSVVC